MSPPLCSSHFRSQISSDNYCRQCQYFVLPNRRVYSPIPPIYRLRLGAAGSSDIAIAWSPALELAAKDAMHARETGKMSVEHRCTVRCLDVDEEPVTDRCWPPFAEVRSCVGYHLRFKIWSMRDRILKRDLYDNILVNCIHKPLRWSLSYAQTLIL